MISERKFVGGFQGQRGQEPKLSVEIDYYDDRSISISVDGVLAVGRVGLEHFLRLLEVPVDDLQQVVDRIKTVEWDVIGKAEVASA